MPKRASPRAWIACLLLLAGLPTISPVRADDADPPTRVARLAYAEGLVSMSPAGTEDWVSAPLNRPLTSGDRLWSDRGGRVELQLDGSAVRLSHTTAVAFLNLSDHVTQIQQTSGTLIVHVRRLDEAETYEIDTPNLAFSILRPGLYRITVDDSGLSTAIDIRRGQGEVTGAGSAYAMRADEYAVFSGTTALAEEMRGEDGPDAFDAWSTARDDRWEHSPSAGFVSSDVIGYEDLDQQGEWRPVADYGEVWFPQGVPAGWAPYREGHWAYIAPWGYTWVDDRPWGFAPFHYGRWIAAGGSWGWVPCPRDGEAGVRPVYAPALVAWVAVATGVAWFALAPHEVYVPAYPVSRGYVRQINVSNTRVDSTIVNNVYNTTIVNNSVVNNTVINNGVVNDGRNAGSPRYANRAVPGAVTAASMEAFTTARPVAGHLEPAAATGAPVRALAPAAVPARAAVLGSGHPGARPPAIVQARSVVARTAPPVAPPDFAARQTAIRANGGRPLSAAEVRVLAPGPTARHPSVRVAPPATPRPVQAVAAPPPVPRADRPPAASLPARHAVSAASAPVHASELPAAPQPPSPNSAESALERQHLQAQQQLRAEQEAQRQRVQEAQQRQHDQLAQQQAEAARQRQLEIEHQQQTAALAQQHAQQQQELLERQQAERRAQESQTKPANRRDERPQNGRP